MLFRQIPEKVAHSSLARLWSNLSAVYGFSSAGGGVASLYCSSENNGFFTCISPVWWRGKTKWTFHFMIEKPALFNNDSNKWNIKSKFFQQWKDFFVLTCDHELPLKLLLIHWPKLVKRKSLDYCLQDHWGENHPASYLWKGFKKRKKYIANSYIIQKCR